MTEKQKEPRYVHAPFPGNPNKNGIINVSTDVPFLPIKEREKQKKLTSKLLGMGGRL